MARRHQEGPDGKPCHAGAHADPDAVAVSVNSKVAGEGQDEGGGDELQAAQIHDRPECNHHGQHHRDGKGMADGDRDKGQPDGPGAFPMQPESHGEKPTHRRVGAVKRAKASQR
ncbi:hypothetical protein ABIA25_005503 [Sinorhizobium fredii]